MGLTEIYRKAISQLLQRYMFQILGRGQSLLERG